MSTLTRRQSDLGLDATRTTVPSYFLHELRNPLNQIIGYAEMLAESEEAERHERFQSDLANIRAAGHRMLTLIEENLTSVDDHAFAVAAREDEDEEDATSGPVKVQRQPPVVPGVLLIVDDDPINRDVLTRRLARQGHIVRSASSGMDALRMMREEAFDLMLLDVVMPGMDGYEVLRELQLDERLRKVPVIMISVVSEMQSVVRCIEAGAEDYLAKPFNPTLLNARIGASLDKKRGRDRESALLEQVQANYRRLQELEQLRDDMRNMIVHDLRTPLTAVIMGVELLQSHGALNDSQHELMSVAANGGKTLLAMVNDLLDVEKMESGAAQLHMVPLSADVLVATVLKQVAPLAAGGRTQLVAEIAPGLHPFPGDENALTRTLVNLIANAIKFTRGGRVTISVSEDAETIRFAIRDTGEGIPTAAFERIFDKFSQLDHRKAGTGLGLAFCKLAVEGHGGHIAVESTPGAGSTFSFAIPRVARTAAATD
jgi:signal transduction histidine kinase